MKHINHKTRYSLRFHFKYRVPITFHPLCNTKQNTLARLIARYKFTDVNCNKCLKIFDLYGDYCTRCYELNEYELENLK